MTFVAAQPVIKIVSLPFDAMLLAQIVFPSADDLMHRLDFRKTNQGMQVIRHQKQQVGIPPELALVMLGGFEDHFGGFRITERIGPPAACTDSDKEDGRAFNPEGSEVIQDLSLWELHALPC